jgi:hypothetical protein
VEGIRIVHLGAGVLAIIAGPLAGVLLRRRDPLRQGMWEHTR